MRQSSKQPKVATLNYSPLTVPPATTWTINVDVSRAQVPEILEQLHSIMHERQGASFYYPKIEKRATICRYEWSRRWERRRFGLRLGLVITVTDEDVAGVQAYAADARAIEHPDFGPPQLSRALQKTLPKELVETLVQAMERSQPARRSPRHVVFHIEMPPWLGVHDTAQTSDGRITLFPTTVVRDKKRVSAVCSSVTSASNESAKAKGLRDTALLCALLSLATDQVHRIVYLKWPKARPKKEFLDSLDNVDISRLYPRRKVSPTVERCDARVPERMDFIWSSFHALSDDEEETFLKSLFAYYSAEQSWHDQPTLASVAYMASLANLAGPAVKKCAGTITCSQCGELAFRHNVTGDAAAIAQLCCDLSGLNESSEKGIELKALVRRVYSKQRSAFVHDAAFRHGEHQQDDELPSAFPTVDEPVSDLHGYQTDLFSIRHVTRRVLLEWLSKHAEVPLDYGLLRVDTNRVLFRSSFQSTITLPKGVVVGMQMKQAPARRAK